MTLTWSKQTRCEKIGSYLYHDLSVSRVHDFTEHLLNKQREVQLIHCHIGQGRLLKGTHNIQQ